MRIPPRCLTNWRERDLSSRPSGASLAVAKMPPPFLLFRLATWRWRHPCWSVLDSHGSNDGWSRGDHPASDRRRRVQSHRGSDGLVGGRNHPTGQPLGPPRVSDPRGDLVLRTSPGSATMSHSVSGSAPTRGRWPVTAGSTRRANRCSSVPIRFQSSPRWFGCPTTV